MRQHLHGRRRTISRLAALLGIALSVGIVLSAGMGTQVSAQSEEESVPSSLFLPLINGVQGSSPLVPDTDAEYEYIIIEEDIQVPLDFFDAKISGIDSTFATNFWPNGIVPYDFDDNVSDDNRARMRAAMDDWEAVANVRFRQCASNDCSGSYIHVQDSNVNNSAVGRIGRPQTINIVSWGAPFIIMHELAHALGFWHEQSHPEREDYVRVNYENVCTATDEVCNRGFCRNGAGERIDCAFNFDIQDDASVYGPYDFDSVMHYDRMAFSRNDNDTITVLAPYEEWQTRIGQRDHLSAMDQLTMSFLYPQGHWRFVDKSADISWPLFELGTFLLPYEKFTTGVKNTPNGGTLWVQPGTYAGVGTYSKPMTIRAPLGGVTLH